MSKENKKVEETKPKKSESVKLSTEEHKPVKPIEDIGYHDRLGYSLETRFLDGQYVKLNFKDPKKSLENNLRYKFVKDNNNSQKLNPTSDLLAVLKTTDKDVKFKTEEQRLYDMELAKLREAQRYSIKITEPSPTYVFWNYDKNGVLQKNEEVIKWHVANLREIVSILDDLHLMSIDPQHRFEYKFPKLNKDGSVMKDKNGAIIYETKTGTGFVPIVWNHIKYLIRDSNRLYLADMPGGNFRPVSNERNINNIVSAFKQTEDDFPGFNEQYAGTHLKTVINNINAIIPVVLNDGAYPVLNVGNGSVSNPDMLMNSNIKFLETFPMEASLLQSGAFTDTFMVYERMRMYLDQFIGENNYVIVSSNPKKLGNDRYASRLTYTVYADIYGNFQIAKTITKGQTFGSDNNGPRTYSERMTIGRIFPALRSHHYKTGMTDYTLAEKIMTETPETMANYYELMNNDNAINDIETRCELGGNDAPAKQRIKNNVMHVIHQRLEPQNIELLKKRNKPLDNMIRKARIRGAYRGPNNLLMNISFDDEPFEPEKLEQIPIDGVPNEDTDLKELLDGISLDDWFGDNDKKMEEEPVKPSRPNDYARMASKGNDFDPVTGTTYIPVEDISAKSLLMEVDETEEGERESTTTVLPPEKSIDIEQKAQNLFGILK